VVALAPRAADATQGGGSAQAGSGPTQDGSKCARWLHYAASSCSSLRPAQQHCLVACRKIQLACGQQQRCCVTTMQHSSTRCRVAVLVIGIVRGCWLYATSSVPARCNASKAACAGSLARVAGVQPPTHTPGSSTTHSGRQAVRVASLAGPRWPAASAGRQCSAKLKRAPKGVADHQERHVLAVCAGQDPVRLRLHHLAVGDHDRLAVERLLDGGAHAQPGTCQSGRLRSGSVGA